MDFHLTTDSDVTESDIAESSGYSIPVTNFCMYYIFTFRVLLALLLFFGGLAGNSLTIIVFWKDRNKSATVFLLICLAFSDNVLLVMFMMFGTPPSILRFAGKENAARRLQNEVIAWIGGAGPTTIMLSMGFTVAVTWQRYVSVCLPYKAKKYGSVRVAKILAVIVVSVAILFNFPRWFEQRVIHTPTSDILVNTPLANNLVYTYLHGVVLYYALFYITPTLALVFMTYHLVKALHESQIKRQEMTGSSKSRAKEELTMSLVVVVIIFIICQSLSPVRRILLIFYGGPTSRQCGGVLYFYEAISVATNMLNSAVNFVVYVLFARRFRKQITMLCHCSPNNQVAPESLDAGDTVAQRSIHNNTETASGF